MKAGLFYNKEHVGDVLIIKGKSVINSKAEKIAEDIYKISKDNEVIGYNFFNISSKVEITSNGVIYNPSEELLNYLNSTLRSLNEEEIEPLLANFKVGKVIECEDIEGTHLHLCKVDVKDEVLQIVCGAYNVKKDIKVVVAMLGTLMSDGTVIEKGELQGYESFGMLCSKRELNIPTSELRGLYILDDSYNEGDNFLVY